MMQLICNGMSLDLYENANIQFTHENPLFAFDDLKCERTTQFKLPSTSTNDSALTLARVPAYKGDGMRRRFAAQMTIGQIVKNGYLYVSEYDGKDYSAIFVTGEMVGLQTIKDAGKLRDYYAPTSHVIWDNPIDAENAIQDPWAIVKYMQRKTTDAVIYPSMQLQSIINGAASVLGVNVQLPAGIENMRLLVPSLKPYEKKVVFSSRKHAPTGAGDLVNNVVDFLAAFEPVLIPIRDVMGTVVYYDDHQGDSGYCYQYSLSSTVHYIQGWRAKTKVFLWVDRNFDGTYLQFNDEYIRNSGQYYNDIVIGERLEFYTEGGEIDNKGHKSGAGGLPRTTFEAGDTMAFLKWDDVRIVNHDPDQQQEGQTVKVVEFASSAGTYASVGQPDYDLQVNFVAGAKDLEIGDEWAGNGYTYKPIPYEAGDDVYMYAFLPDCTLIELLKAVAYVTGKVLAYENGSVIFSDLDFSQMGQIEISDVITKRGTLQRIFSNYAQRNMVNFDSDETVSILDRISIEYDIDNDNLTATKELAKIFASEGSILIDKQNNNAEYLYLENGSKDVSKITICQAEAGKVYLTRVSLPKNAGIERLCDISTQVKLDARMNALAYNLIKSDTLLLLDGLLYVWTSRQWQKEVASFTLAKI